MTRPHSIDPRTDHVLRVLSRWLAIESAAVLAYGRVLRWLRQTRHAELLARCRDSHRQRAELLAQEMRRRGGQPQQRTSVVLVALVTLPSLAALWSERAALRLLRAGERAARRVYRRAADGLRGSPRVLARHRLLPEQRWTAASIAAVT